MQRRFFGLLILAAVAAAALFRSGTPPGSAPLSYEDFEAQWNATANAFTDQQSKPLYDRATLSYRGPRLELHLVTPDGAITSKTVDVPSRAQLTPELLRMLGTIGDFQPNRLAWTAAAAFGLTGVLVVLIVLYAISLFGGGRVLRQTSAMVPILAATTVVALVYRLNRYEIPVDWFTVYRTQILDQGIVAYLILWFAVLGFAWLEQIHAAYDQSYWDKQYNDVVKRLDAIYSREGDIAAVQRLRDEILDDHERSTHLAFTTVRYCEWVLPLLGFLGTVIGLGSALGYMQDAVRFNANGGVTIAANELNRTFGGMAMSFYTTLLGLLFMLLLAFTHFWLRNQIENAIARFSSRLTETIEKAPSRPARVEVVEIAESELTLTALKRLSEQQAGFVDILLRCVREDELLYDRFGPILFERFVASSAKYAKLVERIQKKATEQCGTSWRFEALGAAADGSDRCGALIKSTNGVSTFCGFDVVADDGTAPSDLTFRTLRQKADRLMVFNATTMLMRHDKLRLGWWNGDVFHETSAEARDHDILLPLAGTNGTARALLVACDTRHSNLLQLSNDGRSKRVDGVRSEVGWNAADVSPDRSLVCLAENGNGKSRVTILRARPTGNDLEFKSVAEAKVPHALSKVAWLPDEVLLLLAPTGEVSLFDTKVQQAPVPLRHRHWTGIQDTTVISGSDGWFAAAKNGEISMWRVTAGGSLVPSPRSERVPAAHVMPPRLVAVGVGTPRPRLIGATEQFVAAWDFPQDVRRRVEDDRTANQPEPRQEAE
jgi:hypothetical protein